MFVVLVALAALVRAEYYAVRFKTPITNELQRQLEHVLAYEVRDYLGGQSLLLWLDNSTVREQMEAAVPAVQSMQSWARILQHNGALRATAAAAAMASSANCSSLDTARFGQNGVRAVFADQSRPASAQPQTVDVRVRGRSIDESELRAALGDTLRIRRTRQNRLLISGVSSADVGRVAEAALALGRVKVAEVRMPFKTLNRWAVPRIWYASGGDQRNSTAPLGLTGRDQLLSISDTGVETDSCFFVDSSKQVPLTAAQSVPSDSGHRKIRAYWTAEGDSGDVPPYGGHGTHVAGSALGRPLLDGSDARVFSGTAPDARLVFVDLHTAASGGEYLYVPDPLDTTILQWSYDCGARIHSASWGAPLSGRYTSDEAALDRFTFNNREFLPIFAAGNSGPSAGSIVSPAMAKNALTIGATMNGVEAVRLAQTPTRQPDDYSHDWLAQFSSRGSASLSFRKPDLVAPGGAYIWSAANTGPGTGACAPLSQTLIGLQGTSMATPHASAAAVLVRQYFVDGLHHGGAVNTARPMASLIRATMVASAVPLRGTFPRAAFASTQAKIDGQGHGRIALDRVFGNALLTVLANEDAALGVSRTQTSRRWCVSTSGAYESIVVAMAYADYPSFPLSSGSARLVNDLRLRVYDGDTGAELSINELAIGVAEQRSTIERAMVQGKRRLIVDVHAAQIGFGDEQTFSLVIALVGSTGTIAISEPTTSQTQCRVCGGGFEPVSLCEEFPPSTSTAAPTTTTTTTLSPTPNPTPNPTPSPTPNPTPAVTPKATAGGAPKPTARPTPKPTSKPTPTPTSKPTPAPTTKPTTKPTSKPTPRPTPKPPTPRPTSKANPRVTRKLVPPVGTPSTGAALDATAVCISLVILMIVTEFFE